MNDYTPTTDRVRADYAETYEGTDDKRYARFDRWLAEVERAAEAKALTDAAAEEERVSQQYERTADGMREREEWADSNRYANYAAGHAASAHALRKRAAALGLTAGQEGGER